MFILGSTHLDNTYFCTGFSTSESSDSRVLPLSFLASTLNGKDRIAEVRTNMAVCQQTNAILVFHINFLS